MSAKIRLALGEAISIAAQRPHISRGSGAVERVCFVCAGVHKNRFKPFTSHKESVITSVITHD
jgi:hypothetical protein